MIKVLGASAGGTLSGAGAAKSAEDLMDQMHAAIKASRASSLRAAQAMADGYTAMVSGVLLHAMALDNLARDGANYPADRHHEATEILAFVLVILFAFSFPRLLAVLERPAVRRSFAILGAIVWVVIVAACVQQGSLALAVSALLIAVCLDLAKSTQTATYFLAVIFAALAAGLTQSMGWTPGNWLGLTLLIIGFGHMLKPFYHGSSASRLPGRYSLLGALWTRWRGVPSKLPDHAAAQSPSPTNSAATPSRDCAAFGSSAQSCVDCERPGKLRSR